ncbi:hypothetical protein K432DRAFT_430837 [Lepidopterella palustris CBS 459.81]|uniref:Uncharacterized protein n=1 Tax=Lepidopterella palustris CBS 459.81 TaxID=1314670 RepID=A0A8E2J855_9PEZI|nr:hypothetical protein K432DRAFT_430837 [Lepidopterella palustris CBS 459.81]
MTTMHSNVLPYPTFQSVPTLTSPLFKSAGYDSSSVQNIAFGVISTALGIASIVIACLQLLRMRMARAVDREEEHEMA